MKRAGWLRGRRGKIRMAGIAAASAVTLVVSAQMFPAGASEAPDSVAAPATPEATGSAKWFNSNVPLVEQWAKGQGGSGYYWDEATKQFVVRVTGEQRSKAKAALTASRMSTTVRLETAVASKEAVDETLALVEGRDWYPGGKTSNISFYYDPFKDVTAVQTDAPASAVDTLKRTARTPILVEHGAPEQTSRFNDAPPHFGAAKIVNERAGNSCTAGFSMIDTNNGNIYMVTAGHCGERSDEFYSGQYKYGRIVNKASYPATDAAALACDCPDYQRKFYIDTNATITPDGSITPVAGRENLFTSGAESNSTTGRKITSINATSCTTGGACTRDLIATEGGPRIYVGDSGAPMYEINNGVWLYGIVVSHAQSSASKVFATKVSTLERVFNLKVGGPA